MEWTLDFSGKTALLTGGASGMGFLTAKCYAESGANVVLVDYNEEALDKCVEELRAITPNVIGVLADVRCYEDICRARDAAIERFGSIDIAIPFAGGAECRVKQVHGKFYELPIEVIDFGIDVNLMGAIYLDHAVMPQMVKQNSGVIIHLGSITGEEGSACNIAYAASKSALMTGVTKSVALAGASHNIRCVCVAPGPVLTREAMANMPTLIGRAAEVQELVDMILFATSEKGAFLDGINILMDGGRSIMTDKSFHKKGEKK